jgi:hypothetical protein
MTQIKLGWARQQYGRDRADFAVDMADLPLILNEAGINPHLIEGIAYSKRWDLISAYAEVLAAKAYLRHEAVDAGWRQGQPYTDTMTKVDGALKSHQARLAKLLAGLDVKELADAGTS